MPKNLQGSKNFPKDWLLLLIHAFVRGVIEKNIRVETTGIKTRKLKNIDRYQNIKLYSYQENKNKSGQNLKGNQEKQHNLS